MEKSNIDILPRKYQKTGVLPILKNKEQHDLLDELVTQLETKLSIQFASATIQQIQVVNQCYCLSLKVDIRTANRDKKGQNDPDFVVNEDAISGIKIYALRNDRGKVKLDYYQAD